MSTTKTQAKSSYPTNGSPPVPPGYKRTNAGVVPENWDTRQLKNIADFTNGKPHERHISPDGRYQLITLDSIGIDGKLKVEHKPVSVFDHSLQRNDIVAVLSDLAYGNLLGLCDLIPSDGTYVLNQRVGRLRLNTIADPRFVRLQINRQQDYFKKRGQGTSQRHIYRRDFDSLWIPFPSEPEQRAIAKALSDMDGLLGALEKLIAKKRAIKQAAMQQLLTGKTRLPGFTGKWETKRLGDLGPFSKGRGIRRDDVSDEGVPCIRYGELYTRYHNYVIAPVSRISTAVARTALPIKTGDLLFAGSGETAEEIGRCAAYLGEEPAYAGGDIVVLSPHGQNSMYLGHLMNHPPVATQKARFGQGDAVVHINARNLAQVEIDRPPIDEQTTIATALLDMDAEIAALEQRLDKTKQIKQGMMQELLTGRVRLVNGEANV